MEVPSELISMETFGALWAVLCALWSLAWLVLAAVSWRSSCQRGPLRLLLALCGPLFWGLWALYRARIAYNSETGVAGMHRVSVLLTNLLVFIAVGLAVGAVASLLARRPSPPSPPEK